MTSVALPPVTVSDIEAFNFSRLVGYVNEPNTCSGAARTIRTILREVPALGRDDRVLEVGSNTGFSVLHMASALHSDVYGIDVESNSVARAQAKAAAAGLGNARFSVGDGTSIDFPDDHFTLVFASNVTSFIPDRTKAVDEYYRVLSPFGTLATVPIFYARKPPQGLRDRVAQAIGAPLPSWHREDWEQVFERPGAHLYFAEEYAYDDLPAPAIDAYVTAVIEQECNDGLTAEQKEAASRRLHYFFTLFNENLQYARYAILLYRSNEPSSFPVLHTSHLVPGTTFRA